MTKFRIVLRGDHGGELDAEEIQVSDSQADSPALRTGVLALVDRCTLSPGDSIVITEVE